MRFFLPLLICVLSATFAHSAQINLPQDTDGWTVFTPSSDTKVVYVSTSGNDSTCVAYDYDDALIGSDPFEPVGAVVPCATPSVAYSKVSSRTGYPDWILYKRGDTFTTPVGANWRGGRSATEPFLVGAYGSSGLSPEFNSLSKGIENSASFSWAAFSGLNFYAIDANPSEAGYVASTFADAGFLFSVGSGGTAEGLLVEGCKFSYHSTNAVTISSASQSGGYSQSLGSFNGATIRRSVIAYAFASNGGIGLWSYGVDGLVLEENIWDHNGWYDDYSGTIAPAAAGSHTTYLSWVQNATVKNNFVSRSTGLKDIARDLDPVGNQDSRDDIYNHIYYGNLLVDNTVPIGIGRNKDSNITRVYNATISNNVFYLTGYDNGIDATYGWDVYIGGFSGGSISENLHINQSAPSFNYSALRMGDNMIDMSASDNVVMSPVGENSNTIYHSSSSTGVSNGATGPDNFSFSGNYVEVTGGSGKIFETLVTAGPIPISEYSFSSNQWYSNPVLSFHIDGVYYTQAEWLSSIETTATFTEKTFTAESRTPLTYLTNIGETATLDNLYDVMSAQDRYDWNVDLEVPTINDWIRTGFDMSESVCDADHLYLCDTSTDCTTYGGYWYDNGSGTETCNITAQGATCDGTEANASLCNETECEDTYSWNYCDGVCQVAECSASGGGYANCTGGTVACFGGTTDAR